MAEEEDPPPGKREGPAITETRGSLRRNTTGRYRTIEQATPPMNGMRASLARL